MLTAPATRRVTDCGRRITYAGEEWRYDDLALGSVSDGRVSSHTVDRRATDNGALLQKIRRFDATYDAAGSLSLVSTERGGSTRASNHEYDLFGLVVLKTILTATGVPSMASAVTVDPVTLEPLETVDTIGTKRGAEFDGYGRIVRTTITPPGGQAGVVSTIAYQGFDGVDPGGRRVVIKEFRDPVPPASIGSAPGLLATMYLDELGRERRSEAPLGVDYGAEVLVFAARLYDELGRVSFVADPYPISESADTAYGTNVPTTSGTGISTASFGDAGASL